MRELTENQKSFILNYFFVNEKYAGWKEIGKKLLERGKCIVAGREPIWRGGIGNFIKTQETDLAVDCLEYNFDLDSFLESGYFKGVAESYTNELIEEVKKEQKRLEDMTSLVKDIFSL